ncbi:MAG: response regulator [Gammaproteobacteria bacterium]|jgi:two-component system response regulator CpxR|nr:response regulator [Gammaproteobacteria bacterium]
MNQPSVLIVDDDVELCEMLEEFLSGEGMKVTCVHDGPSGKRRATEGERPDAVVLDVMMPGTNGFDVLRAIRQASDVPVIMLTARGDDTDRIVGLELGADDYLPKPFNPRELAARLRAVWRRGSPGTADTETLVVVGRLRLDRGSRHAHGAAGEVSLTGAEFGLLELLAESPGEVRSKDELSQHALGREAMPFDRSVDTHVSRLRQKLEEADAGVDIRNVRGRGYCLTAGEPES